jgi:serine protease inhibitor
VSPIAARRVSRGEALRLPRITAALIAIVMATNFGVMSAQAADPVSTDKVVAANNGFGFRLLHALRAEGDQDNVIISPLSVSLALGIVFNGAGGATREAMAGTLGFASLNDQEVNGASHQLLDTLAKADPAVQLEIANALWVKNGFALNAGFVERVRDYFEATLRSLNFSGDPEGSAKTINDWVDDRTHGKIPSIIGKLEPQTRLVVTDAVYFKGRWRDPFKKELTRPHQFTLPGGLHEMIPMMDQRGKFPYLDTPDFQAIRLAYGNRRFDMYVFLPRQLPGQSGHGDGLPRFLESLNEANWNDWTNRMSGSNEGRIMLPKFELKYSKRLNQSLDQMGMGVAFDASRADLSGIPAQPAKLWIDFVEHKTYIKVDEEGTEAAAVTAVGVVGLAVMARPRPFEMIVDHSFFFAITERGSRAILFAGIVTNPAGK